MHADVTFWDNLADRYANKPVDNPDAFQRKIDITKSHITPASLVLDIGCGTGSLCLRLADTGAQLHGLDLSPAMIAIANKKRTAQSADNVAFSTGPFDASFDVFEPGSLDGICAYSILHLVADRDAFLDRAHTLLKPGGFLIHSTVCLGESAMPYGVLIWTMRMLGKAPEVAILPKKMLANELEKAGFVNSDHPDVGASFTTEFTVAFKPN